jgi:hypothetical protein
LDLVDGASKAWILVEKAQAEWNRIQNENQLKKKLKEEKEKVSCFFQLFHDSNNIKFRRNA